MGAPPPSFSRELDRLRGLSPKPVPTARAVWMSTSSSGTVRCLPATDSPTVQFHPESILTPVGGLGLELIRNAVACT